MSQRLSCLSTDFGLHLIRTIASFFSSVFVCQRYGSASAAAAAAVSGGGRQHIITSAPTGPKKKKKRKDKEREGGGERKTTADSSLESGVDCDGLTSSSSSSSSSGNSSRSSSSSSISGSLRYSTSSCELVGSSRSSGGNQENSSSASAGVVVAVSTLNPPTIVLTTPSGHRHQKSLYSSRSSKFSRRSRSCKSGRSGSSSRSLASRLRFSTHLADFCNFHSDNDNFSDEEEEEDKSSYDDDSDMEQSDDGMMGGTPSPHLAKVKVTEKDLNQLNHKIEKLLVKLEEEYETEIATSPDEECVICISAKATMQTFPCGHRVVCRKCFVKTIQMVVTQRMLPLRCVICRAKVIRLKQTTTGGLSTGHVRLNSKHSRGGVMVSQTGGTVPEVGLERGVGSGTVMINGASDGCSPLSRPSSLLLELSTAGLLLPMSMSSAVGQLSNPPSSKPSTPTRSPTSPLTEVFRAQKALYELQFLRRTSGTRQLHQSAVALDLLSDDQEQDQMFSEGEGLPDNMDEPISDASWNQSSVVGSSSNNKRLHQFFFDDASNKSSNSSNSSSSFANRTQQGFIERGGLRCPSCGSYAVGSTSFGFCEKCQWVWRPGNSTTTVKPLLMHQNHHHPHPSTPTTTTSFFEHQLQSFPATTTPPSTTSYLMSTFHRKRKQSRYLQHRRWLGSQRQQSLRSPLSLQSAAQQQLATLLNAEQQHFVQLPLGLLEQPIGLGDEQQRRQQTLFQYSLVQVKDLGASWQKHQYQQQLQSQQHSFLLPIDEEEEDRWWQQQQQKQQWNSIEENECARNFQLEPGAISTTNLQISTQSSGCSRSALLQSQHSHQHHQNIFSNQNKSHSPHNNNSDANSPKAFAGKHQHYQHYQHHQQKNRSRAGRSVQAIRKSRSESFLATSSRYRRLNDCSAEEEGTEAEEEEEAALTEPNDSGAESEGDDESKVCSKNSSRQASNSTLSARIRQSSSSLGRLAYSTITESFKMFRSLKLH